MDEFKSLNGFPVKDETARKAVETLADNVNKKLEEMNRKLDENSNEDIEQIAADLRLIVETEAAARAAADEAITKQNETAKFFFPSLETGGYTGSSALAVIGSKCVLLDCGPTVNWEAIKAYYSDLYKKGIFRNIDYIVISHYHYDHVENLEPILDMFPHEGVTVYLPMNPDGYLMLSDKTTEESVQTVKNSRSSVIAKLQNRGLQYVEVSEETTVNIAEGFCNMTLFNSSPADYLYYQQNSSVYNNFSMCALFKTGNLYSMFPGDVQKDAHQRIVRTRDVPRLFLYAIHHHGYDIDDDLSYLDAIRPQHGVISSDYSCMVGGAIDSIAANYATENLYSTAYGACEFVIGKDAGSVVLGREISHAGWYNNYIDLYVNNDYTGTTHKGTEEAPFTSVNEINTVLDESRNAYVTVHVKATGKPYGMTWLRNYQQHIYIKGYSNDGNANMPVLNGVYISGCDDICFGNIEISGEGYNSEGNAMVHIMASCADFHDCLIRGKEVNEETRFKGIQLRAGADVYIADSEIQNCYHGITFYRHGRAAANGVDFSDCRYAYMLYSGDLVIRGEDTASNVQTYIGGTSEGGAQYRVSTRPAESAFKEIIATNDANAISNPFFHTGIGVCIAVGASLYKLPLEAINQAAAE